MFGTAVACCLLQHRARHVVPASVRARLAAKHRERVRDRVVVLLASRAGRCHRTKQHVAPSACRSDEQGNRARPERGVGDSILLGG